MDVLPTATPLDSDSQREPKATSFSRTVVGTTGLAATSLHSYQYSVVKAFEGVRVIYFYLI